MISLSEEWALLSKAMYGKDFIDELTGFLRGQDVKTILECGCGDGYILKGLAQRDFKGLGIDSNPEMISLALKNNKHSNISYKHMSWLDIRNLERKFDLVMCRGNSLPYVISWDKQEINSEETRRKIKESVGLFFEMTTQNGLIYIDTISQEELDKNGGNVEIKIANIHLEGKIQYDWQNKIRRIFGGGRIENKKFVVEAVSYLLTPYELEKIVRSYNPSVLWKPELKHEKNYYIVCAKK